ncbi:methyltransferase domain-containing protein [Streptomyces koyangensis]|uniref:methyltransferase domain-containing protein n=1 Tax=Streptomyces koyangensis TaxID=188770 RepID=UPI003C2B9662
MLPADQETDAPHLRHAMAEALVSDGALTDPGWRAAVERVPRHRFVPGFYLPADELDRQGLTVWEPVTPGLDYGRWLAAAYSDVTLITQFDGDEPDWSTPVRRHGGSPTSSSTLPSLAVQMWADADVAEGHTVLEIGTGTGYSTALACERLDPADVTSIEIDPRRLEQAAGALFACGYTPTLAVADGLYGYWPEAKFDRIVAACSFRAVPPALLGQTRPGGKILLTLSGWLYGYARVLLTVKTEEAFHLRFLAQCAVPDAQMTTVGDIVHLVDVVTGSAATLTPAGDRWEVREDGPVRLWERIEDVLCLYDEAGRPGPETFTLHVYDGGQHVRHPQLPALPLRRP